MDSTSASQEWYICILVIFAKNMHQKTVYFRAPDAKFFTALGEETSPPPPPDPPPLGRFAPLQFSSEVRAHPDFRIPRKMSSYGPAYTCL